MRIKYGFMIFLSLLVLSILSFGVRVPTASALDSASVAIVGFYDYSGDCGQTQYQVHVAEPTDGVLISYRLDFTGFVADAGWSGDVYAVIVRDVDGTIIGADYNTVPTGSPYIFGESGRIKINDYFPGQLGAISGQPHSRPWSFEVHDVRGNISSFLSAQERFDLVMAQPIVGVTVIDPAAFSAACEALPFLGNADEISLNNGVGDLEAQLFVGFDDAGNPAINVYEVNSAGEGWFAFQITLQDIAPFVDNAPSTNTQLMVSASGKVVLYILDTGEFQINIGPDRNGEVFVTIFDTIPPEDMHSYTFNVYDILDD